jgi:hypothetical protein
MTKPKSETSPPVLILYGLDANEQPRAAGFDAAQADLAIKAAESLKLNVLRIETPDQIELARELPAGQILASGKGLVSSVRQDLYDKLVAAVVVAKKADAPPERPPRTVGGMSAVAQTASEAPKPKQPPTSWAEIDVGDLVLAEDRQPNNGYPNNGWYEAVVLEQLGDNQLKIRFRDYPEEGTVVRRRNQLALLAPA